MPLTARLGLAIRAVGDWQFGDVPFYELARYEDTFAFGGVNGVRGIPGQRYYGRIKLFSNVELRSRLLDFTWFRKPYALGGALFTDFGRLWTDFAVAPRARRVGPRPQVRRRRRAAPSAGEDVRDPGRRRVVS